MKKEYKTHFLSLVIFFALITAFKRWFDLSHLQFWIGGLVGMVLPDVDYLIYIYFLRPAEPVSLQAADMIKRRKVKAASELLISTRRQRVKLIFHTAYFQIIFLILAFFVITSSESVFGRGLVLAFSLHLLINQFVDWKETRNLDIWFAQFPFQLDAEQRGWYMIGNALILFLLGFYF